MNPEAASPTIRELLGTLYEEAEGAARRWRWWRTAWKTIHYLIGAIGAVAGVVASFTALEETAPAIPAAAGLLAAAAVALQTFFKPAAWAQHNQVKFAEAHKLACDVQATEGRLGRGLSDEAQAFSEYDLLTARMEALNASHAEI